MPTRIDWFDDPNAPAPNSVVPSANVVVADEDGRILLIRRSDNGNYALPGGAMELGESLAAAAVREAKEETGYDVKVTGVVGIYTNPGHVVEYTSNGEVRQEFTVVLSASIIGGAPTVNDEATEVTWVDPAQMADLQMTQSMRERIRHFISASPAPYLG